MKLKGFLVDGLLIHIVRGRATLVATDDSGSFVHSGNAEDLVLGLVDHGVSREDALSLVGSDGVHVLEREAGRIIISRMVRAKEIN